MSSMTQREDIVRGKLQWYKIFYKCIDYLIKWRTEDSKRDSFFYLYSKGCVGRHVWGAEGDLDDDRKFQGHDGRSVGAHIWH